MGWLERARAERSSGAVYSGVTAEIRGADGDSDSDFDSGFVGDLGEGRMCEDEKSQNKGVMVWFPSSSWEAEGRRRILAGLTSP